MEAEIYVNHFFISWEEKGVYRKPTPQGKDSIEEIGWFALKEAELLPLKSSHRLALIELCYHLEKLATQNQSIAWALGELIYSYFEKPSETNGKLLVKNDRIPEMRDKIGTRFYPAYIINGHSYDLENKKAV